MSEPMLDQIVDPILGALLRANLALALGVLAALALRQPVRRQFGARTAYVLWALPLLAALASLVPAPKTATLLSPVLLTATGAAARALPQAASGTLGGSVALALWAAGSIGAAALLARQQARFMAQVRAGRGGPAVVGVMAPRIVIPADFEARFDVAERALILSHERAHLARGDALANAATAALQCLCWWNPLAHLGARMLRIDQELACDATVLARHPDKRRLYAHALLKTQLAAQALPLGCHWPAGAEHPLKERITMLKSPLPARARRLAGLSIVGALSLCGAAAAWAAQGPAPLRPAGPLVTQPDWIVRPTAADVMGVYPAEAAKQKLNGDALISCAVMADGRLEGCAIERETPAGAGFGAAAIELSRIFRMKPASQDGRPVAGGQVRIPIRFVIQNA